MGKTKELTVEQRERVLVYSEFGWSQVKISKRMKISRCCVQNTLKRFRQSGSHKTLKRTGRPKKTNRRQDMMIKRISLSDRKLTAPKITSIYNSSNDVPIGVSTVKNRLKKAGLNGRVAAKKPLLRIVNKRKRLLWAQEHKNWTVEMWTNVLWTDETKFEIFGSKRRVFVRRFVGERFSKDCLVSTVKHGGGSLMIWGCFGGGRVGRIHRIHGIMNKEMYRDILENVAVPSGEQLFKSEYTFMHDNDPKHASKLCKGYLDDLQNSGVLKVMNWPAQSPDLNPIELLWEEMDRNVREKQPTSINSLWNIVQECWNNILPVTLEKLIKRMPRLCAAVIKNRGGHFDETKI